MRGIKALISLVGAGAWLLAARWVFRIGKPRDDWWHLVELWERGRGKLARLRVWALDKLTVTSWRWKVLRRRYQDGAYGLEGI